MTDRVASKYNPIVEPGKTLSKDDHSIGSRDVNETYRNRRQVPP